MIKKLIKKVKDFLYSTVGTMTMAVGAIIAILPVVFIGPVQVFTYMVTVTIGGMIYILQTAQENEEN